MIGVAIFLAFDTYSLLIGETASPATTACIRAAVAAERTAIAMTGIRTLHIGPESLFIALRIRFRDDLRTHELEAAIARLKDGICAALAGVTRPELIVIEPASVKTPGETG